MADISKLILPSGDEYNYKDAYAREFIQNLEPDLDGETSTVTGDIVSFETESAQVLPSVIVDIDPVQNLHGYDHPWPAGGGKNLLPKGITSESHDIIYTVQDNGEVIITGTASSTSFWCVKFTIPAGTYIINGCPSGGDTSTYRIDVRTSLGGNLISSINPDTGTGTTFTISEPLTAYLNIRIASGYSAPSNGLKFSPMILLASETNPSFAPYSNICPISGWNKVNVRAVGKNWWNPNSSLLFGFTNTVGTNGVFTSGSYEAQVLPRSTGPYVLSGLDFTKISDNVVRVFYSVDYPAVGVAEFRAQNRNSSASKNYEINDSYNYIVLLTKWNNDATQADRDAVQIESGNTATSHVPYVGQTIPIAIPNPPGTVYGGTLDVTNGVLTVDRAMVDMGTLDWHAGSGFGIFWIYSSSGIALDWVKPISNDDSADFICSKYQVIPYNEHDAKASGFWWNIGSSAYVGFRDPNYINWTAANVKSDLSGETLIVRLKSPVTYQLTPTQVTALLGQNNILADTGDSTVIYRTGKLALLSDVADSEERVREDLNNKIDSLTAVDVGAAKDSSIANVEPTSTASTNYAVGDYLMLGGVLYEVTVPIASGETITQGTNVTPATVMESMAELVGAIPQRYNASTNPTGYLTISDLPLYDGTVI